MIPDATLTSFVFCVATLRDSLSCRAVGGSVYQQGGGEKVLIQVLLKRKFLFLFQKYAPQNFLSVPTTLSYIALASYREA